MLCVYSHIIDRDDATFRFFKEVDAAKKCGLSCSGRSDDSQHIARMDLKAHIIKNHILSESFAQIFNFYHLSLPPRNFPFFFQPMANPLDNDRTCPVDQCQCYIYLKIAVTSSCKDLSFCSNVHYLTGKCQRRAFH